MDHGSRPRAANRHRADSLAVDLGNEPPLSVDGGDGNNVIDRRRVSVQWFSGTILTGVCGAALMGGAVWASLDGESNFAQIPERVGSALRGAIGEIGEKLTRKADRLPPVGDSNGSKQLIRISVTTKVGDREVVRVRPYYRVSANLVLAGTEFASSVPPFDAQKMLAQAGADGVPMEDQAAAGAEPDAEVSYVTRDLAAVLQKTKLAGNLPMDDVLARVRDTASWTGSTGGGRYQMASLPGATPQMAYAPAEGTPDPYVGFETRIVPENITLLPKTAAQAGSNNTWNERVVAVKKGDTIETILKEVGATTDEIAAIASALGPRGRKNGLKEGQKLRILASATETGRLQPLRVMVLGDSTIDAVVALSDMGKYVSVDVAGMNTMAAGAGAGSDDDDDDDGKGIRLYQSIYETALRNNIPKPVIEALIRIYSYDIDFQHKASPGDSFDVLYAADDDSASSTETKNDVFFAALTTGGEPRKYYRYQTPDDSIVDYYDETGKSAKKFLVRKPVAAGIMRSGFGSRNHPLLGYTKMHTGVDWAAPLGTPIYASGNGSVEKVGWESGYGKYVRIKHANGYETAYGHMTAFARSTQPGARVRQGQVIGYVGSTGLSTGPHVHYEILVNGRFVDPLRVKLPRGRVLDGPMLSAFEKERDKFDGIVDRPSPRVAQSQANAQR